MSSKHVHCSCDARGEANWLRSGDPGLFHWASDSVVARLTRRKLSSAGGQLTSKNWTYDPNTNHATESLLSNLSSEINGIKYPVLARTPEVLRDVVKGAFTV